MNGLCFSLVSETVPFCDISLYCSFTSISLVAPLCSFNSFPYHDSLEKMWFWLLVPGKEYNLVNQILLVGIVCGRPWEINTEQKRHGFCLHWAYVLLKKKDIYEYFQIDMQIIINLVTIEERDLTLVLGDIKCFPKEMVCKLKHKALMAITKE